MKGATIPPEAGPTTTEQLLFLEVINRAIIDAQTTGTKSYSKDEKASSQDRAEAISFLTDESGDWAISRVRVCDAAGIDPHALRERMVRILANPDESAVPKYKGGWSERRRDKLKRFLSDGMEPKQIVREFHMSEDSVRGMMRRLEDETVA